MTFLCDIDFLLLWIFITSEGFFQTGELSITVNSEIFVRVLYSRNFAYAKFFVKIKSSQNGEITLLFTDIIQLLTYVEVHGDLLNSKCHIDRRGAEVNMIKFTVQ